MSSREWKSQQMQTRGTQMDSGDISSKSAKDVQERIFEIRRLQPSFSFKVHGASASALALRNAGLAEWEAANPDLVAELIALEAELSARELAEKESERSAAALREAEVAAQRAAKAQEHQRQLDERDLELGRAIRLVMSELFP